MRNKIILTAHTDGASKGNPGPASIGFTIEKNNAVVEKYCEYIGKTTNNIAEYTALITAIKRMKALNATDVIIYSDSELAVKQINGIYKVRNIGLKPIFSEVIKLLKGFDSFRIIHVSRKENSIADCLANKAINERNL